MKLEEATAVLRPRGSWEALDLGCALARRHWASLMRGWFTVALPLWALILLFCHNKPLEAAFWTAWTIPVLTRQPVFFLSRALFGQAPGAREFWRGWRLNFRGIVASLTVKRFAMQRPFRLPVIMLEGQRGGAYTQRAAVLSAHGGGSAALLTIMALLLRVCVVAALTWITISIVGALDPEWWESAWFALQTHRLPPASLLWIVVAAMMVSTIIVEPFFAAAGFALYINTRTHLEGWDIEVAFRRMSARLAPVALVCAGLFLLPAGTARAAEMDSRQAKAVVEEILQGPDFELEKIKIRTPKPKEPPPAPTEMEPKESPKEKKKPDKENDPAPSSGNGPGYGGGDSGDSPPIAGYLIIAVVAAVVFILLWKNRRALRGPGGGSGEKRGPRVVMGMDVTPESLPDDVPQVAWREYLAGRPLEALRLLYRGSLAWLVDRASLPVHESDTEGDCLRHSANIPDAQRVSFFTALTSAWVNCAYAGLPPAADPMKHLCDRWPFSLRQPRGTSKRDTAPAWMLLPLAALVCAGCGVQPQGEYDEHEEIAGYKGAARANPWLAAERLLTRTGTPAETRPVLGAMPATDAAVFLPLGAVSSRGEAASLLRWVHLGGHLIVACTGTARFHNDYRGQDPEALEIDSEAPLLKELKLKTSTENVTGFSGVAFHGDTLTLRSYNPPALDLNRHPHDILAGTPDAATLASFAHGSGRVTLLASATPFRNRYLAENDHAAILLNIIGLEPSRSVIFVSKSDISLWDMLQRYAWMPVTATALLIVLWLWRHLSRFGRAVPADESVLRHFGTHLDEAGRFLSERAGPAALLAAARRAAVTAAARIGLHSGAPDFLDHLAARSGLTPSELSLALHDVSDKNLVAAAAALQKLQLNIGPIS